MSRPGVLAVSPGLAVWVAGAAGSGTGATLTVRAWVGRAISTERITAMMENISRRREDARGPRMERSVPVLGHGDKVNFGVRVRGDGTCGGLL